MTKKNGIFLHDKREKQKQYIMNERGNPWSRTKKKKKKITTDTNCFALNIVLESLARKIREKNDVKVSQIRKEVKLS